MGKHSGQVPGQGGTSSLRVQAGGQGERLACRGQGRGRKTRVRGGGVRGDGGAVSAQDQRHPCSEAGQVRWRARAAARGAGSSWTRWAQGRVRHEAEGPEGLGCGPKRVEGGPVPLVEVKQWVWAQSARGMVRPQVGRWLDLPVSPGRGGCWGPESVPCAQGSWRIRRSGGKRK